MQEGSGAVIEGDEDIHTMPDLDEAYPCHMMGWEGDEKAEDKSIEHVQLYQGLLLFYSVLLAYSSAPSRKIPPCRLSVRVD